MFNKLSFILNISYEQNILNQVLAIHSMVNFNKIELILLSVKLCKFCYFEQVCCLLFISICKFITCVELLTFKSQILQVLSIRQNFKMFENTLINEISYSCSLSN